MKQTNNNKDKQEKKLKQFHTLCMHLSLLKMGENHQIKQIFTPHDQEYKKKEIKLSENEHFTRHIKCAKIERHKPMRWIGLCVLKSVLYAYTQYHHWRVFAIFFFRYFWRLLLPLPSNGSFLSLCSVFVCGARIYILRFYLSFSSLSTINK